MTAPPPAAVRDAATEVFARPEFRPGGPPPDWLVLLVRPLAEFFAWLGTLYTGAPLLFWVLLVGCVLALVGMVALITYQVRAAFAGGGGRAAAARAERVRRSAEYRAEADRRAAAGDYTEAVRFLFLSLVYRLDERGRVGFRTAYTNREYLALVGDRAELRVMVDVLDDHWYGQTPCGRDRYDACRAVYDRLA